MRRGFPFNLLRNASLLNFSNLGRVIFANSKRACAASFSSFAARSLASALNLSKASSLSLPDFCENPHAIIAVNAANTPKARAAAPSQLDHDSIDDGDIL